MSDNSTHQDGSIAIDSTKLLAELPKDLKNLIDKQPKDKKEKILLEIFAVKQMYHSGPLPHPDILERYNAIIENGAERIFVMAQDQAKHRFALENHAVKEQLKQSGKGQLFGFILGLIGLSGSIFLGYFHETAIACTIGGGSLVGLVGVFVYGKSSQSKSLKEKSSS